MAVSKDVVSYMTTLLDQWDRGIIVNPDDAPRKRRAVVPIWATNARWCISDVRRAMAEDTAITRGVLRDQHHQVWNRFCKDWQRDWPDVFRKGLYRSLVIEDYVDLKVTYYALIPPPLQTD